MSVERDEAGARALLRDLVSDVRQWAEWSQVLGADSLPIEPHTSRPAATQEPAPASRPTLENRGGGPAPSAVPTTSEASPIHRERPRFEPPTRSARSAPSTERATGDFAHGPPSLCARCGALMGWRNRVFGLGPARAELIIIGEGQEQGESPTGEPFMGRSGQLLTRMLGAIGLRRDEVYICNVFQGPSPGDDDTANQQTCTCTPSLMLQQFKPDHPKVVMAVGELAGQRLLDLTDPIEQLRERPHDWEGLPVVVSHHPEYLLRNPRAKGEAWMDLLRIKALLKR